MGGHARLDIFHGKTEVFAAERHLSAHVHAEELRFGVLEHAARHARRLVQGSGRHVHARHLRAPGERAFVVMRHEAVRQPRDGGFAAARSARQKRHLARFKLQGDAVDARA